MVVLNRFFTHISEGLFSRFCDNFMIFITPCCDAPDGFLLINKEKNNFMLRRTK